MVQICAVARLARGNREGDVDAGVGREGHSQQIRVTGNGDLVSVDGRRQAADGT